MKRVQGIPGLWAWILVLAFVSFLPGSVSAQNSDVLGEVQFDGKTNVEKTSGVWVDGQYVGYLKELKASKKILLLPGEHTISVRQNGYQDFTQTVVLQPGQTQIIRVTMDKAATGPMPADAELATIKINVNPSRAAGEAPPCIFIRARDKNRKRARGRVGNDGEIVHACCFAPVPFLMIGPYEDYITRRRDPVNDLVQHNVLYVRLSWPPSFCLGMPSGLSTPTNAPTELAEDVDALHYLS